MAFAYKVIGVEQSVESREYQEREERRGRDAANDHGRQGPLHLGTYSRVECHRDESERGNKSCHQHGSYPTDSPLYDGFLERPTVLSEVSDEGHHD